MERVPINIRLIATAVVAFLGFWLLRRATDFELSASQQGFALVAGIVLFFAAVIVLFRGYAATGVDGSDEIGEPRISRFLFSSTRSAPLWLGARLYLGYEWIDAGRHKFSEDAWMKDGTALKGYWERAVAVPEDGGTPRASYGIFREYLDYMLANEWYTWFAKVIVFGEILVGVGLIVGGLTGLAAFGGALMNMSFMMAGTVSTNPILFILSIFIILGWRVAGWFGLDRVLLPMLGTPWKGGKLVNRGNQQPRQRGMSTATQ